MRCGQSCRVCSTLLCWILWIVFCPRVWDWWDHERGHSSQQIAILQEELSGDDTFQANKKSSFAHSWRTQVPDPQAGCSSGRCHHHDLILIDPVCCPSVPFRLPGRNVEGLLFVSMFHGGPSSTSGKTHWAHHRSGRSFNAVVVLIGATQDTLQSSGTVSDAFLDDVSVVTVPNDSSKSTECWRKVFGQMQASGCTRGRRRANYIARVVEPGTTEDFCRAHDVGAAFCPKGEQTGLFLAWPVIHARHLDLATRLIEELERLDIPFLRTLTGTRDFEPPSLACRADGTRPQLRDPPDFELGGCDKGGNISTWKSPSSCETKLNDSQVWFVSQTHFGLSSRFVHFAVMDLQEMYFERQFGVAGKCFWLETCWVWLPKLQTNTMPTRSFTTNHWFAIRIIGVLDSLHCGPRRLGIRGDAAFAQFFNEHKFVFHVHASSDMVIQTRSESCPETRNRQDRTKSDVLEDVHFHQQRRPQDFRCSLSAVHWENKAVWFGKWSLHSWWRTTI